MNSAARNLRVAALVGMLVVYFGHQQQIVEAAPVVTEWCSNVCDDQVSCSEPCLMFQGEELPGLQVTCGTFDGGPSNDWCNGNGCEEECSWSSLGTDVCWWENESTTCEDYGIFGECGDDICVAAQGEDCNTCPEDCGGTCPNPTCGAYGCELGESWRNCPLDCEPPSPDDCGDGVCGTEEDTDNCAEDCVFPGEYCGTSPYAVCPSGWACVDDQCVFDDPNQLQCCGGIKAGCVYNVYQCPSGYFCKDTAQFFTVPVCVKLWDAYARRD